MLGLLRPAGVAVVVCLVAACGKVGENNYDARVDSLIQLFDAPVLDPCAGNIALENFPACLGKLFCERSGACGHGQAGDTDCSNLTIEVFPGINLREFTTSVKSAIAGGRVTYDGEAAATCLAAIKQLPCRALFGGGGNPLEACGMLIGKVAAQGGCAYPFECASGTVCALQSGNSYDPTCGNDICKPRVAVNQSCTTAPCSVGDHCSAGVCTHGALNDKCAADNDCDPELFCGTGAVCVATVGKDGACTTDRMCAGNLLCVGEHLSPAAGKCADVTAVGAPCDDECVGPFLCTIPAVPNTLGMCVAAPAEGQPCASTACGINQPQLGQRTFMRCDNKGTAEITDDVCATPGDLGAVCAPNGCNIGLLCTADVTNATSGTCRQPLPNDTACNGDQVCASGSCRQSVCSAFQACSP
jgi:Dickkopf N-terminal cysteine-rich region